MCNQSKKMDSLITFNEAAEFLKNPPSLSPRPDFTKLCVEKTYGKGTKATSVPPKPDPQMVGYGPFSNGLCAP